MWRREGVFRGASFFQVLAPQGLALSPPPGKADPLACNGWNVVVAEMPEGGPDLGCGLSHLCCRKERGAPAMGIQRQHSPSGAHPQDGQLGLWSVGGEAAADVKEHHETNALSPSWFVSVQSGTLPLRREVSAFFSPFVKVPAVTCSCWSGGSRKAGAVVRGLMNKELGVMLEEPTVCGSYCAPSQRASWDVQGREVA